MTEGKAREKALELVSRSEIALVGSNGQDGYPHIKAMLKMEAEALNRIWFSTNTSSRRVAHFRNDARASVYFVDFSDWMGLLLLGRMEILDDLESRQRLWRDGCERYYPRGVTDPDYSVLRFTTMSANYYHNLANVTFIP